QERRLEEEHAVVGERRAVRDEGERGREELVAGAERDRDDPRDGVDREEREGDEDGIRAGHAPRARAVRLRHQYAASAAFVFLRNTCVNRKRRAKITIERAAAQPNRYIANAAS